MRDAVAEYLDALPVEQAVEELRRCCGSTAWARAMAATRPFRSGAELARRADALWRGLPEGDRLEAFASHPRIGERRTERAGAGTAEWSAAEQAGMAGAEGDVRTALARGTADYEAKFGFVFLICATGLDAATMLERLRARLANERETELRNAAAEQAKITTLRLEKLVTR